MIKQCYGLLDSAYYHNWADGTDKLSVLRVLGVTQFKTQLLCSEIKEIEGWLVELNEEVCDEDDEEESQKCSFQ